MIIIVSLKILKCSVTFMFYITMDMLFRIEYAENPNLSFLFFLPFT